MKQKPLPCPFCGTIPAVGPLNPEVEGNAWGYVQCINPKCQTFDKRHFGGVRVEDGENISDERGSDAYKDAAIRRWNSRPD